MVLVIFNLIPKRSFEIQLAVINGVIVLGLNISMIILYCRYAGTPYKSDQHYKNLRHCGLVAMYWTLSFSLKLITSFIDSINPGFNYETDDYKDTDDKSSDKLLYATIYFSLSIVCDIVPLMLIVDSQFIKILTFDLIHKYNQDQTFNNDIENAANLLQQENNMTQITDMNMVLEEGELGAELKNIKEHFKKGKND